MDNLLQEEDHEDEIEFRYNYITLPWDDRSKWSKISIVLLLIAIFGATLACVINSFRMQFKGYGDRKMKGYYAKSQVNCQIVKVEDYAYVAKIYSTNTLELVCVGALISAKAVLTNGACTKNKQVRIYIGRLKEHYCKKGFAVTSIEQVYHEGVLGRKLVLLMTDDSMLKCGKIIQIFPEIDETSRAYVIGRALLGSTGGTGGRSISRQPVQIIGIGMQCSCQGLHAKRVQDVICVKSLAHCPILAGDLLIQGGRLFGFASTSLYREDRLGEVCFADLRYVIRELKEFNNVDFSDYSE